MKKKIKFDREYFVKAGKKAARTVKARLGEEGFRKAMTDRSHQTKGWKKKHQK